MNCSIIIPAHNEEKLIARCLQSIREATHHGNHHAQVIVAANRCTDQTTDIANSFGAFVLPNEDRNLAKIRNAGALYATQDVIITIDADSWMTPNTLTVIEKKLQSGKYIGGGITIRPERYSAGIIAAITVLHIGLFLTRLCGGLYWCRRHDFNAIGGFNETLLTAEDLDFAKRLRAHGRARRLRLHKITEAAIYTSCRKFDTFGDWFFLRMMIAHPNLVRGAFKGNSQTLANRFFYDYKH